MNTSSFDKYQSTNHPCFLLDKNFSVIKYNQLATHPSFAWLLEDGVFADTLAVCPAELSQLQKGNIAYFNFNKCLPADKRISAFAVDDGYFVSLAPPQTFIAEPWFTGELRERISSIFATLPIIDKKLENDKESATYINSITRNCYELLRTTQNISALTKVTAADKTFVVPLNVKKVLTDIISCANTLCVDLDIPIVLNFLCDDIFVDFDIDLFEICVTNILLNSMQYSQDNNTINIKVNQIGDNAVIIFADNGKGIKEQAISQIYAPYFSTDPYMDGEIRPGLGLGLTIVNRAIFAAGGTCSLQSEFGEGCRLAITIPLSKNIPDTINSAPANYYTNRFSTPFIQLSPVCQMPKI